MSPMEVRDQVRIVLVKLYFQTMKHALNTNDNALEGNAESVCKDFTDMCKVALWKDSGES